MRYLEWSGYILNLPIDSRNKIIDLTPFVKFLNFTSRADLRARRMQPVASGQGTSRSCLPLAASWAGEPDDPRHRRRAGADSGNGTGLFPKRFYVSSVEVRAHSPRRRLWDLELKHNLVNGDCRDLADDVKRLADEVTRLRAIVDELRDTIKALSADKTSRASSHHRPWTGGSRRRSTSWSP